MQRVGGVPEGAALDITFLARDDVGAPHAQRFCQWLVETQSCRYTSVVNYLNGLVSMMNFVYFELNVEESVLSMSPNPLEQLANLRDQANGQVKQQNLFSPTSIRGGWIAWAQVQETRVKIMSGVNARPPGVTGESDEKSRVKLLGTGQSSNIRDTDPFLVAWEKAIAEAFDGLKLEKVRGSKVPARPNGYWTTELTCR